MPSWRINTLLRKLSRGVKGVLKWFKCISINENNRTYFQCVASDVSHGFVEQAIVNIANEKKEAEVKFIKQSQLIMKMYEDLYFDDLNKDGCYACQDPANHVDGKCMIMSRADHFKIVLYTHQDDYFVHFYEICHFQLQYSLAILKKLQKNSLYRMHISVAENLSTWLDSTYERRVDEIIKKIGEHNKQFEEERERLEKQIIDVFAGKMKTCLALHEKMWKNMRERDLMFPIV